MRPRLLLLSALAAFAYACPHHDRFRRSRSTTNTTSSTSTTHHNKRWYGVTNPDPKVPDIPRPWPIDERTGHQSLRICFVDQGSHDTLVSIIQEAIAVWQPAMDASAMTIEPECGVNQWQCLCDDKNVRWDALRIEDATEKTDVSNGGNESTVGWNYASEEDRAAAGPDESPHEMRLTRHEQKDGTSHAYDVWTATHELGHALGLDHEHQRPNAYQDGVVFDCPRLPDANWVKKMIDTKDEDYYEDGDTFHKACTDISVARRYEFTASQYMPQRDNDAALGSYVRSKDFDWDSIMLYPSYLDLDYRLSKKDPSVKFPTGAILKRRIYIPRVGLPDRPSAQEMMGGGITVDQKTRKYDFSQPKISPGDIARIAQLYPNNQDSGRQAASGAGWERANVQAGTGDTFWA